MKELFDLAHLIFGGCEVKIDAVYLDTFRLQIDGRTVFSEPKTYFGGQRLFIKHAKEFLSSRVKFQEWQQFKDFEPIGFLERAVTTKEAATTPKLVNEANSQSQQAVPLSPLLMWSLAPSGGAVVNERVKKKRLARTSPCHHDFEGSLSSILLRFAYSNIANESETR